jgi:outer membrane lipoprotein-sorting protein
MNPADRIKKLINKSDVTTSSDADKRILGDALEHLEKLKQKKSATTQPNIWRIIMKNTLTKVAIASVLTIACLTGLFFWKSTGSGIALADVLTRIEQVTGYMYQMRSTITRQQTSTDLISTVLISQENGIKITTKRIDPNNDEIKHSETYLLPKLNSVIFVMHEEKTYIPMKYNGMKLEFYKEEYNDPRIIIKQILSCEHTSLGQSVIDGITVEGFQTTDPAYEGGFMGQADFTGEPEKVDVKLWVDVNTFMPIRLEEDIVTKKGTHMHEVSYDFRWNVVVNSDDFKPVIPEDYTSPGEIIIPAFNEETAIKGLKLFANLDGTYPIKLSLSGLREEAKRLTGYDPRAWREDAWQDLSDDEKTKKRYEQTLLIGPAIFYRTLVEENKDPAYYGEMVGTDDTNKVLLRWKLDNGQYRVIFGDLSIKNVTPEELAELEKPLLEQ